MSDWIAVVLLGIIEGITEFLPVSSTGHLLLAEHWIPRQSDLFNVVIQSGAVLAVLPLFPERLRQFAFRWRERATQDYAMKIAVACVLTGIPGFILEKKGFKLPEELWPVAWALLVGGIGFIVTEAWLCGKLFIIARKLRFRFDAIEAWLRGKSLKNEVTWAMAVAVGFGQVVAAVFPGASRSGTTILLCLLFGLARPAAVEFCFLAGIPTMLAASGLKIFHALHHHAGETAQEQWGMVGLGFVVSAVVSFIAVRWLLRYVQSHTFTAFGWYRIGLALAIFLLLVAR